MEMHVSRAHAVFAPLLIWTTIRVEELACAWENHIYTYFTVNGVKMVRKRKTYDVYMYGVTSIYHIFKHTYVI